MRPDHLACVIALSVGLPPAAHAASTCSLAGTDAYREQGLDPALVAFAAARDHPECVADTQLAFNYARTLHAILDRDGDDARVCRAADAYAEAIRDETLDATVRVIAAREGSSLTARCTKVRQRLAASAPITPPVTPAPRTEPTPSTAGAWLLTATSAAALLGAGVAWLAARDALGSAKSATERAEHAARPPIDAAAHQAARRDYTAAIDDAHTFELSAWILLGAGAALGTWAVITWTHDVDDFVVNVHLDGPAVRVEGRF